MHLSKSMVTIIVSLLVLALSSPTVFAKPIENKDGKGIKEIDEIIKWFDRGNDHDDDDDDDDPLWVHGALNDNLLSELLARFFGVFKFKIAYGTIVEVHSGKGQPSITIRNSDNKLESYHAGNGVNLWLDGKKARLNDLDEGDLVAMLLNPAGHVLTIVAISAAPVNPTPGQTQTGTVTQIINQDNLRAVTIKVNNKTNTYLLAANAKVTFKNWAAGTFADIRIGDQVTFKLVDGKISELFVLTITTSDTGLITAISTSAVTIKRENGTTKSYAFAPNLSLTIQGISSPKLGDVKVGDTASLLIRDGIVHGMDVIPANLISGTIQSIIKSGDYRGLIIQKANGNLATYAFAANGKVSFKNLMNATFDDIRQGDLVTIRLAENQIIELVIESVATSDRGTITAISTNSVTIRRDNNTIQSYVLGKDLKLTIAGVAQPKLSDVLVGDQVELGLRDAVVFSMQVTPAITVSGTIEAIVNQNSVRALTIKKPTGEKVTYMLAANASVVIKDQPNANFASLMVGDTVTTRIAASSIVHLEAEYTYTTVEGTVTLTDLTSNPKKLYLLPTNGSASQAYLLNNPCSVTIPGITSPTLSQIKIGDRAKLHLRGNLVHSIMINPHLNIFNAIFVRITDSNTTPGIEIIQDEQVVNYTLASSYTVVVPDQTSPTLANVAAGQLVTITLENNLVTRIEVLK